MEYALCLPTVSLTGATVRTIGQIVAPSTGAIEILSIDLSFGGVVATDAPIPIELLRQTSAGTSVSASSNISKFNANETATPPGTYLKTFSSTEPTDSGDVVQHWLRHPQSALVWRPPARLIIVPSERMGIRATPANTVNSRLTICLRQV